jgi:hypothetical protein
MKKKPLSRGAIRLGVEIIVTSVKRLSNEEALVAVSHELLYCHVLPKDEPLSILMKVMHLLELNRFIAAANTIPVSSAYGFNVLQFTNCLRQLERKQNRSTLKV